ncbi:MAG TPA: UDP-glucose--hexose-1-phosphate uridylyltransferase [Bryobacteraceae bacterium]|nr:UDP-glucose--hexose-1-phosphate uridylyltransferase [Bryobacteraceae bacterium]
MLTEQPHRRLNPLTREWVLVSPHRTQRPWQGQVEKSPQPTPIHYDPTCYLCPGNARAGGVENPNYETTFVFENDFAALKPAIQVFDYDREGLLVAKSEPGICRVVCFLPDHSLTVARMKVEEIRRVIDTWTDQYLELGAHSTINSVQIFENRGEMMGASNPHPHCQIWSNETLPNEHGKELGSFRDYRAHRARCLLCEYINVEESERSRIVCENDAFLAVVPFWAGWPFETLVMSKRHFGSFEQMDDAEKNALASLMKRLTTRYDNLFETSFPYTMGFHQRPTDGQAHDEWHFHAHYYPPLLRSATVRKFMVGYELLATPQRDITPESAAQRLTELSEEHYLGIEV